MFRDRGRPPELTSSAELGVQWVGTPANPEPGDPSRMPLRESKSTPAAPSHGEGIGSQAQRERPASFQPDVLIGRPRRRIKSLVVAAAMVAVLAAGGYFGHYLWTVGRVVVSNDAAEEGRKTTT